MGSWKVETLGVAHLVDPAGERVRLERRAAALFAYLALSGRVAKYPLSCLLWPDSAPATVRNNMRQLLRRLRLTTSEVLVEGDAEWVQLTPGVQVDLAQLAAAAERGDHTQVLTFPDAPLLEGVLFDDCPELARWLDSSRYALEGWRRRAREGELARLEAAGEREAPLRLVRAWVQAEPESEEAARAQMRLHYVAGERSAALAAFERIKSVLETQLDLRPMPETLQLARTLEQGGHLPQTKGPGAAARLPLSVLRPPVLAGRTRAWEQLNEAYDSGQIIFITGEPGIGKSRLAEEFAESRGRWFRVEGRIGDRSVPYSSQARALRTLISQSPGLQVPERLRRELLRILPELGEPWERPPPLTSEGEKLRFYDAMAELTRSQMSRFETTLADDVQYWDAASNDYFLYAFSHAVDAPASTGLRRVIDTYREAELPPDLRASIERLVALGHARIIRLGPLEAEQVQEMMSGLGVAGVAEKASEVWRHTGGNPLFVVETVKHLLETGSLQAPWPERLPAPAKVASLIQRRLERLSSRALVLAQVAAVSRAQFSLPLAARMLRQGTSELRGAVRELEEAQVLLGERFSHDLVQEAVEAAIPAPMKGLLHGLLAALLEEDGAAPILVAHHWMQADEPARALPQLLRAASAGEEVMLPQEAADLYARAAHLLSEAGRHEDAARVRERERRCRLAVKAAPEGLA